MTDRDELQDAFLDDHRVVTRALHELREAVERGDFADARRHAGVSTRSRHASSTTPPTNKPPPSRA